MIYNSFKIKIGYITFICFIKAYFDETSFETFP